MLDLRLIKCDNRSNTRNRYWDSTKDIFFAIYFVSINQRVVNSKNYFSKICLTSPFDYRLQSVVTRWDILCPACSRVKHGSHSHTFQDFYHNIIQVSSNYFILFPVFSKNVDSKTECPFQKMIAQDFLIPWGVIYRGLSAPVRVELFDWEIFVRDFHFQNGHLIFCSQSVKPNSQFEIETLSESLKAHGKWFVMEF